MMEYNETRLKKINFIEKNKEIFKNNLMTNLLYNNKNVTIIYLLISILLSNKELDEIEAKKVLEDYLENKIIIYKEANALYDIIGTMKLFIMKIYNYTDEGNIILEELSNYEYLINSNESKKLINKMA